MPPLTPQAMAAIIQLARGQAGGQAPTASGAPAMPPPAPPPDMGTQSGTLPPTLFSQAQQPPPAAPSGVVQPSLSDAMQQQLQREGKMGEQETGTALARGRAAGDVAMPAIAAEAAMPIPKTGWLDTQGQPQKPGVGHAILRALTALAAATGPGQAIEAAQYGPGIRRYQMETGSKAKQIEELQKQQQLEQAPLPSTTGMMYHPMMAGARLETAEAATSRAATAAGNLKQRIVNDAALRQIDWRRLDLVAQAQELHKQLALAGFQVQMRGQDLQFDSREDAIAAVTALQGSKMWNEMDESLKAKLMNATGFSTPLVPSAITPGSTTPAAPGAGDVPPAIGTTPAARANRVNRARGKGAPGSSPDNPIVIK